MNAPLPEYFEAEDKGNCWHLFCKTCGKGWALAKGSTGPGNTLHLLNHVRGHMARPNTASSRRVTGGRKSKSKVSAATRG
jgi:hypothetical protein